MKYTVSIEIALPREEVVQLLADPAHISKWLRGVVLHEPLSGVHGQVGTKSRVVMQMGRLNLPRLERQEDKVHDSRRGKAWQSERSTRQSLSERRFV